MIECSGITKSYGAAHAVRNVSFSVKRGEIFGIVGPDGAGKSSLMKILATTLEPDRGSLAIEGVDAAKDLFRARESIAYMPQRFGLYEDLTVEENAFFFGHLFGVKNSEIKKRLVKLYDFSRLGEFKDRRAGKLSGGMKQKLGLVCALIHTPKVLILDEPTNGVDPVSRREFWMILYELLSEGVAIIVSTAYLDEAERCARLALMDKGSFIMIDEPLAIKKSITKDFIRVISPEPSRAEESLSRVLKGSIINRTGNTLTFFSDGKAKGTQFVKNILHKDKIPFGKIIRENPSLEDCFTEILGERNQ
jgi:ABC-2 type transport system ATP-binding protein